MPGRILDRHVGGNTTYARNLAAGLCTRGVAVESLPYTDNPVTTMVKESVEARRYPESYRDVLHYVADTGPLLRTRRPSVVTVHGIASRWIDGVRNARQEGVWRTRVKRAIASTDALITVSESSADDISDIFGVDRALIDVIPHGIDFELFRQPAGLSPDVAAKVPERFLLYVGNIEPRKNLEALVDAVALVRKLGMPLVVAGKPAWNSDSAQRAIESSPDVVYLGFVSDEDRSALMQRCALFVFPSRYEGFGFPVLEAMAAGAPVLTSHAGALREVAGPAKILEALDAPAIADGISRALGDSAWQESVKPKGCAWASGFTWDASVDAHLGVYKKVTER
ncbi:glycosyltransferase family 1 protein [Rhodococcus sp. 15-649-1-2]|nr:glycosyltransferase family 1 protein [Rhodococcus sp. 15-649-1-2]